MKRNIQFQNPVFHKGLNCTVRRGYKWANLKIGEVVLLNETKEAVIEKLLVARFGDVKNEDIEYEHDPICRRKESLFKVLSEIYPNFTWDTVITIIYFRIK